VQVRPAILAEEPALRALLDELVPVSPENAPEQVAAVAATLVAPPAGRAGPFCLMAWDGDRATGFVSLSGFVPARGFTWGLLLNLLYVAEAARGSGAARALTTAAARFAVEGGYSRLEWNTNTDNARARAFYAKIGVPVAAKLMYRVEGDALAAAAGGAWPARITEVPA
jgi:GNAT superfamily N-acetyltransferase